MAERLDVLRRLQPSRRKRPDRPQLSVYSPQTFYTVPLLNLNGQPYVGLVDLLEPLGTVDARPDGKKYKLKFTPPGTRELEFQFQDGKDNGKVKGDKVKLAADLRYPKRPRICSALVGQRAVVARPLALRFD